MNKKLIIEQATVNFFILTELQKLESRHLKLVAKFEKPCDISGLTFEGWIQKLLSNRIISTYFSVFETTECSHLFEREDLFLKVQRLDVDYLLELLTAILTQLDCGFIDLYYE